MGTLPRTTMQPRVRPPRSLPVCLFVILLLCLRPPSTFSKISGFDKYNIRGAPTDMNDPFCKDFCSSLNQCNDVFGKEVLVQLDCDGRTLCIGHLPDGIYKYPGPFACYEIPLVKLMCVAPVVSLSNTRFTRALVRSCRRRLRRPVPESGLLHALRPRLPPHNRRLPRRHHRLPVVHHSIHS